MIKEDIFSSFMKKLEGQELYQRLQEARNLKKLNRALHQRLEAQEKQLKYYAELTKMQAEQIKKLEKLSQTQGLLIEELQRIIFGKKKKKKDDQNNGDDKGGSPPNTKTQRDKSNYQRPIPTHVTETKKYRINQCTQCHTKLANKRVEQRYLEDILLPNPEHNPWKKVAKKLIETGWCPKCRKQRSAELITGAKVQLGPGVRAMVVYLTVVQRQTYSQVSNFFKDLVQIPLSDGEIATILNDQAMRAGPEHARIEKNIATENGVHADETPWKTLENAEGNYAWVKTGTQSFDTIFRLGKSRGKGNAEKIILAEHPNQTGISDDYAAYDNVFEFHELCWSHPLRKLRNLKDSSVICHKAKLNCTKTFLQFQKLYADSETLRKNQLPFEEKKNQKPDLIKRFVSLAQPKDDDPQKLKTIKETLLEKRENYFVWLEKEGIPLDNNKAERALRSLVIKRKISFGSKTAKGAENLGILFSVVMSLWWKRPANFFTAYANLLT